MAVEPFGFLVRLYTTVGVWLTLICFVGLIAYSPQAIRNQFWPDSANVAQRARLDSLRNRSWPDSIYAYHDSTQTWRMVPIAR
ncbi:MAG TPA: hypothetical protein PK251_05675 [Candidatus Latescibacteria bacterium]|nr:hypothetical protein [Candidatus Latescibacterota bacterium]HOF60448.1 hypothetical protein [Candidatus Latescibacterota bacterium]HOS64233.1 hypothetical protein [Candidatus Latescibacterota bacterium]HPK74443.1 hypothetical protein [Candidatus Latescibacterota bacterium]HRU24623.1 hypothetical protein [Candidatus Latescibacterota bacterium]